MLYAGKVTYPKSVSRCIVILTTLSRSKTEHCRLNMSVPFCFNECVFQLAVNFDHDTLFRFRKDVMDNTYRGPRDRHYNLLFWFWNVFGPVVMIKQLGWRFRIAINGIFIFTNNNFTKTWIVWILLMQLTQFKILNDFTFTEFMWIPFIEFFIMWIFLIFSDIIDWKMFWHFDGGFVQLVFSRLDCQLERDVLYSLKHQTSCSQSGTSESGNTQPEHKSMFLAMIWQCCQQIESSYDEAWTRGKKCKWLFISCSMWAVYNVSRWIGKRIDIKLTYMTFLSLGMCNMLCETIIIV